MPDTQHDDGDRWQVNEQLEPAERAGALYSEMNSSKQRQPALVFRSVAWTLRQGDAPENDAECTDTENQNPNATFPPDPLQNVISFEKIPDPTQMPTIIYCSK